MEIFYQAAPGGAENIIGFWQSTLGITIITITAGIIGGLVSHILQRRSQHKTWLLENRITAFAEFIKIFDQCLSNMNEYLEKIQIHPIIR